MVKSEQRIEQEQYKKPANPWEAPAAVGAPKKEEEVKREDNAGPIEGGVLPRSSPTKIPKVEGTTSTSGRSPSPFNNISVPEREEATTFKEQMEMSVTSQARARTLQPVVRRERVTVTPGGGVSPGERRKRSQRLLGVMGSGRER